jgi:capsular polysaccharide export protein
MIRGAEAVYTVTSQGGFEALLHGRPVRTFGMPFYAGWGLTNDDLAPPPRRTTATLEALAHAALIDYARYIDPDTGHLTSVEATIARLARPKEVTQAA